MRHSREAVFPKPGSSSNSPRHAVNTSEYCLEQFAKVIAELLPVLGQIQELLESEMLDLGEKVLSIESHLIRSLVSIDATAVSENDKLIAKGRLVSVCEHHFADQLKVSNSTHEQQSDYINAAVITLQNTAHLRDERTELPITDITGAPSDPSLFLEHLNAYNIPTKRKGLDRNNNQNRKPFEKEVDILVHQILLYHRDIVAIKNLEKDHADSQQRVDAQIIAMRAKFKGQKESYALPYLNYLDEFQAQKKHMRVPQGYRFVSIEAYTAWALEDTIMLTLVNLEQECVRVVIALQVYIGYMFTHCIPVLHSTYRQAEVDTTSIIAMHREQMNRWKDSGFDEMRKTLLDVLFPENVRKTNVAAESTLTPDSLWTMVKEKLQKQLHLAITGISSVICAHPTGDEISPILSVCEDFLTACYRFRGPVNTLACIMNPNQPPQTGFFYACSEIAQIAKKLMPPAQPEASLAILAIEEKEIAAVPSPRFATAPNFTQSSPGSQSSSPRESPPPGITQSAPTMRLSDFKTQQRPKSTRNDVSRLRKSLGRKLKTAGTQAQQPQSGESSTKIGRSSSMTGFFPGRPLRGDKDTEALRSKLNAIEEESHKEELN